MSPMSNESLIADLLAGNLNRDGRDLLEQRMADDPELHSEVQDLQIVWRGMETLQQPVPSERMQQRFEATVDAYRAGLESQASAPRPAPAPVLAWRPRQRAVAIGAALAAMLIGLIGGRWLAPAPPATGLNALQEQVAALTHTVSLTLMQQPDATARLRGVGYAQTAVAPDAAVLGALLATVRYDPNANVRLAAVDALAGFASDSTITAGLRAALPDEPAPLVQVGLIDLLLTADPVAGRDAVMQLEASPDLDETVRDHIAHRLNTRV